MSTVLRKIDVDVKQLGYLINQYPAISHTFVRREIQALEDLGYEIARFSIRPPRDAVISDVDKAESAKTVVVLDWKRCLLAFIGLAITRPKQVFRAVATTARLKKNAGGGLVRHIAYLLEAAHLTRELNRKHVEHLHVHFGTNSTSVALIAEALGGPPFSFTVHGPEEFDRPQAESMGMKIEAAKFVVAISSFGRSQLQRWCPFQHWSKIHIVHCGLDGGFIERPTNAVPNNRQMVCVGRLSEQKGHFVLLEAAKQLAEQTRDFKIVLVGDGDFRPALERFVEEANLQAQIEFVGWQTEAEVQTWLENSRCMVLPSFAEGLPVVIMEALAMGRPVITTYVAGIPELVSEQNGWLVPAGDASSLADAMQQMLAASTETLTRMGQVGKANVSEQHDIRKEAETLHQALTAV